MVNYTKLNGSTKLNNVLECEPTGAWSEAEERYFQTREQILEVLRDLAHKKNQFRQFLQQHPSEITLGS
jgi:hypothetical protein